MATANRTAGQGQQTTMPRRRFRVLDAMILVAAMAVGCGILKGLSVITEGELSWHTICREAMREFQATPTQEWPLVTITTFAVVVALVSPFVAMMTLAFLPIRLLRPRPRFRQLARQPGMIGACGACLSLALIVLTVLCGLVVSVNTGRNPMWFSVEAAVYFSHLCVGLSVLASWMTLVVGRRWRAEASWVDRFGRALGVWWVVAGLLVASQLVLPAAIPLPPYMAYPHVYPAQ
jgi:hypothetical protein